LLDPENSDSKRDVANDYSSLGDLMAQQGYWSEALAQHIRRVTWRCSRAPHPHLSLPNA
jgi:hypothetical protein